MTNIDPSKAIKGLKAALKTLELWGCSDSQKEVILGGLTGGEVSSEQLVRISYILNIHCCLKTIFKNPQNIYGFMSMKNNNSFFEGRTALNVIESGRVEDLERVAKHLDGMTL
ncbi:DUF2384 domain-containing protein [Vibrio superstes]|uniref:DUF2384 domain-containing protein n=1 Tax=Vibrio superstes NBRC 103154 TaxID=1219062 RepID=A0A511QN41_9VIBR|nr:DUF2384 domain-containing protein [Vibrio superstes]GEM78745.1 DUF2384 domain-containing protein [Vibrio superstes NBRC 103154]